MRDGGNPVRSLAQFCYRRRRLVVLGWVLLVVGLFALSGVAGGDYRTEFKLPGSESQAALDLLKERGVSERTGFQGQIVVRAQQGVNDPAVRGTMERKSTRLNSSHANISYAVFCLKKKKKDILIWH